MTSKVFHRVLRELRNSKTTGQLQTAYQYGCLFLAIVPEDAKQSLGNIFHKVHKAELARFR